MECGHRLCSFLGAEMWIYAVLFVSCAAIGIARDDALALPLFHDFTGFCHVADFFAGMVEALIAWLQDRRHP